MKRFFYATGILACALLFLSSSFSMQNNVPLKAGDYELIPLIQKPTSLSPSERAQRYYSDPLVTQGMNPQELAKIQLGGPDSTLKERPVLAVDVDNDGIEEVIVDFGATGIYLYDMYRTPKWTRLDTRDPEIMIAADRNNDGKYEVYVSWGSGNGSQFWEDGVGWTSFNNTYWYDSFYCSADVNDDGNEEIVIRTTSISTGSQELYIAEWAGTYFAWHRITLDDTNGSHAVAFNVPDDELPTYFVNSPSLRWWNWASGDSNWTDNWTSMTGDIDTDIDDCTKAELGDDTEEEFIVDIYWPVASVGTWIYNYLSATKWTRINAHDIYDIRPWPRAVGTNDELVCTLNGVVGLWFYGYFDSPKWNMINGLTPDWDGGFVEVFNYDSDGDWDLAVDFGSTGLWKYDYYGTVKWTSMNGSNPRYMVRVNIDSDTDDELLVVFTSSPSGLWLWDNGTTPKWQRLNGANPDY